MFPDKCLLLEVKLWKCPATLKVPQTPWDHLIPGGGGFEDKSIWVLNTITLGNKLGVY